MSHKGLRFRASMLAPALMSAMVLCLPASAQTPGATPRPGLLSYGPLP